MTKIPLEARKSNEEVLEVVGERRESMKAVKLRQGTFFGHVMWREGLGNLKFTGMVEGSRRRGSHE